jgi:hypothetical protein
MPAAMMPPSRMWRMASRRRIFVVSALVAPPSAPQAARIAAVEVASSRRTGEKARLVVHRRISTSGMEVIEPSRSMSRVTSSVSLSKRTGTSNSKPAVIATPRRAPRRR